MDPLSIKQAIREQPTSQSSTISCSLLYTEFAKLTFEKKLSFLNLLNKIYGSRFLFEASIHGFKRIILRLIFITSMVGSDFELKIELLNLVFGE